MKKLSDFLNAVSEDELNETLFNSVLEYINLFLEPDESIFEFLNDESEDIYCGGILNVFIKNLKLDLSDYGFEEDDESEWGYSLESEDADNELVFGEGLFQDVNEFVTSCMSIAEYNDDKLEESPKLQRLWNDESWL